MKSANPRLIAFYLPQFHPIPENDEWWGRGFTEWRNATKARPMYPGHYQPHLPGDLGFYDLRLPEARQAQAEMASSYGIEGFCYYHYWFGNGRQVLQRPLEEVVSTGQPDFPFCICWANESWTGIWHGLDKRVLASQEYPGIEDERNHFNYLFESFKDSRYIRVRDGPLVLIYSPHTIPDVEGFLSRWRLMASDKGLPGIFFVGVQRPGQIDPKLAGFDGSILHQVLPSPKSLDLRRKSFDFYTRVCRRLGLPQFISYDSLYQHSLPQDFVRNHYPSVIHAWDNTPRSGKRGTVIFGSNPEKFRLLLRKAFDVTRGYEQHSDERLVFLKSWNEWAEGNHLEPDLKFGTQYLQVVKEELMRELS
jgi:hypothetical protein